MQSKWLGVANKKTSKCILENSDGRGGRGNTFFPCEIKENIVPAFGWNVFRMQYNYV